MNNSALPKIDSFGELCKRAKTQADKAPVGYQRSVEHYYIARYLVSVFEARNHEIPIQVWNEYRNGLDHLFRFLTQDGRQPSEQHIDPAALPEQLKKLEGHMQRALLDIMKILCHREAEWIKGQTLSFSNDALGMVNNGQFSTELWTRRETAERFFIKAKSVDCNLGEDSRHNDEVLQEYMRAVFAYEQARDYLVEHTPAINHAVAEHSKILNAGRVDATKKSFVPNVLASIVASFVFAGGGYIVGKLEGAKSKPVGGAIVQDAQGHPESSSPTQAGEKKQR